MKTKFQWRLTPASSALSKAAVTKYQTPAVLAALLLAVGGGYWLGKAPKVGAGDTVMVQVMNGLV